MSKVVVHWHRLYQAIAFVLKEKQRQVGWNSLGGILIEGDTPAL